MKSRHREPAMSNPSPEFATPLTFPVVHVQPEWIDYNGHLNVAYYLLAFDKGVDRLLAHIVLGLDHIQREQTSYFTLEAHINYIREVSEGDPLRVSCQLLDRDHKRIHYFMHMHHDTDGFLAATSEQIGMHIDMKSRRSTPFPEAVQNRVDALMEAHGAMPVPDHAGSRIGIRRQQEV